MAESSNAPKIFSEHSKSIMTLKSEKVIEHMSKTNETNPRPQTKPKSPKNKKDPKVENEPTAPESSYLPKASFLDVLKAPIPADKKGERLDEKLELFKQVQINLLLLDAIKQVPSYAKFLKDLCTQKRKSRSQIPKKVCLTKQASSVFQHTTPDRKSTRLNSSHSGESRMPSSA